MSDSDASGFLNTVDENSDGEPDTAGKIILATGVDWARLAKAFGGSLIVGWFLGIEAIIQGTIKFFTHPAIVKKWIPGVGWSNPDPDPAGGIIDSLTDFAVAVVTKILSAPVEFLKTGANTSADWVATTFTGWMGIAAFAGGVAVLMLGFYVAAKGVGRLR